MTPLHTYVNCRCEIRLGEKEAFLPMASFTQSNEEIAELTFLLQRFEALNDRVSALEGAQGGGSQFPAPPPWAPDADPDLPFSTEYDLLIEGGVEEKFETAKKGYVPRSTNDFAYPHRLLFWKAVVDGLVDYTADGFATFVYWHSMGSALRHRHAPPDVAQWFTDRYAEKRATPIGEFKGWL